MTNVQLNITIYLEGTAVFMNLTSTLAEVKLLQDNKEFSDLIKDIRMPTMRRGILKLHGFSE